MCVCVCVVDAALVSVSSALDTSSEEALQQALQNEHLNSLDLQLENMSYYLKGLEEKKREKPTGRLTEEEVQDCIAEMNTKAELDRIGVCQCAEYCNELCLVQAIYIYIYI